MARFQKVERQGIIIINVYDDTNKYLFTVSKKNNEKPMHFDSCDMDSRINSNWPTEFILELNNEQAKEFFQLLGYGECHGE